MRATRESVYAALFALLETVPNLTTVSRRLQSVQDIQPESFPAAFQLQGDQQVTYKGSVPSIFTWQASWILNAYEADQTAAPSTQLNEMIDAVSAVLAPAAGQTCQTLGGLVTHAGISGNIQIYEGVLGDRAVAIVPISIVLAGF